MFIETKMLQEARMYVDRMCESRDPVTAVKYEDPDNTLSNENFLRSMYFVRTVLDGIRSGDLQCREKHPFPDEILSEFRYTEDSGITSLLKRIYSPVSGNNVQKLTPQAAGLWLRDHGYLEDRFDEKLGIDTCLPTKKGQKIGIYCKAKDFQGRKYIQIYYSRPAQEFIVQNFRSILDYRRPDPAV